MAASDLKAGPLSVTELLALWETTVDRGYWEPLVTAGDGGGLEAYNQGFTQLSRVSTAIDVTMQSMFILPWSGQTNPSAAGGAFATVSLSWTRSLLTQWPIVITSNIVVEEQTTDWGPSSAGALVNQIPTTAVPQDNLVQQKLVQTGRKYAPTANVVIPAGDLGPFSGTAQAAKIGYGYNNPLHDTLTLIDQPGTQYTNVGAALTVIAGTGGVPAYAKLTATPAPNVPIPSHVGQYLQITASATGSNVGQVARIVGYVAPGSNDGGSLILALDQCFDASGAITGTFQIGETVSWSAGASTGLLLAVVTDPNGHKKIVYQLLTGSPIAAGATLTGVTSGATVVVSLVLSSFNPTVDPSGIGWKILDWVVDWGLVVTNPSSPTGGRAAMLDTLGAERRIGRVSGESDAAYAVRVATLADVVTPNAVRRAANRVLGPQGFAACLREIGDMTYFPGFFYDAGGSAAGDSQHLPDTLAAQSRNFAYDMAEQSVTGTITGTFLAGELVTQNNSGQVARGRACLVPGGTTLDGITQVDRNPFVSGVPIVGASSGATITNPTFSGGLSSADRYKLVMDSVEYRGFFMIGVPSVQQGNWGFFYDGASGDPFPMFNAYDLTGLAPTTFYDGTAPGAGASTYKPVFQAVDAARAGGVGFQLYVETGSCP